MARLLYSSSTTIAPPRTTVRILTGAPPAHPGWSGQSLPLADLQSVDGRPIAGQLTTTPSGELPEFFGPDGDVATLYALLPDGTTVTLTLAPDGAGGRGTSSSFGDWIYGDGSDGAITLHDGDVLHAGNYTDVTIVAGATVTVDRAPINSGGLSVVVCCTGTYTINGTVDLRGAATVGSASGNPGRTDAGDAGNPGPFPGGAGGAGGAGPGGAAGARSSKALQPITALTNGYKGGSGEAANGSGDGVNFGGGAGGAGNWFVLCARTIAHGPDNLYRLDGGDGGDGGDDGAGGPTGNGNCGGGGGGGGGWWLTICNTISGTANESGAGGAGGQGCGTGTDGTAGTTGRGIHLFNHVA